MIEQRRRHFGYWLTMFWLGFNLLSLPFYIPFWQKVFTVPEFAGNMIAWQVGGTFFASILTVFMSMNILHTRQGYRWITARIQQQARYLRDSFIVGWFIAIRGYEAEMSISKLNIRNNPGYIYIMRRQDGIYKLGKSVNTRRRLREHQHGYSAEFTQIRRFTVPDIDQFERLALGMTASYKHCEPGRKELRNMTDEQLQTFIDQFTLCCIKAVTK